MERGASPRAVRVTEVPQSPDRGSTSDVGAWLLNVMSCVAIIMVNKQLTGRQGYGFVFVTTLCAMHFIVTSAASYLMKPAAKVDGTGEEKDKTPRLPLTDLVIFCVVANLSIVSLNTSLMMNDVALYQIAKLGIPPFSAVVESTWFRKSFSQQQVGAMVVTLLGVGLVTISDLSVHGSFSGVVVALISVVSSAMQQILCGYYQRKNNISSNDFLHATSKWQGGSLLLLGPPLDRAFYNMWVTEYEWPRGSALFLVLSCATAVLVNASHFICLGRFSAVTYQVLGHTKTVLVLLFGYLLFGGSVNTKQVLGVLLAIIGMVTYGFFSRTKPAAPEPAKTPSPKESNA